MLDFHVTAESNGNTTTIDDFGNTYVSRTFDLNQPVDTNRVTGVRFDTGQFSFVPATFSTNGGSPVATLMRPGNSIYTVVEFTKTFEDLNGHWAKADVEVLASKLVVKGMSPNRFAPENEITRAEFASLLVRAMGISEVNTSKFPDVKSTNWFAGAVNAAAKAGLVDGFEDGTFRPSANITREQMAVMLKRMLQILQFIN